MSNAEDQSPEVSDDAGNLANLVDELNHLRKENARLKERDLLKKATAFFVKEGK